MEQPNEKGLPTLDTRGWMVPVGGVQHWAGGRQDRPGGQVTDPAGITGVTDPAGITEVTDPAGITRGTRVSLAHTRNDTKHRWRLI